MSNFNSNITHNSSFFRYPTCLDNQEQQTLEFFKTYPTYNDWLFKHPECLTRHETINMRDKWNINESNFQKIANNHLSVTESFSDSPRIPLISHQIWLTDINDPRMPSLHMRAWIQKSIKYLPASEGWQNFFWVNDKKALPQLVDELTIAGLTVREISELSNPKAKNEFEYALNNHKYGIGSSILRYEILNEFGGLYYDTDYEIISNPTKIHYKADLYASNEPFGELLLGNAFIGTKPNHPIINEVLDYAIKCVDKNKAPEFFKNCEKYTLTFYTSGPAAFSMSFLEHSNLNNIDVIIDPEFLYSMLFLDQYKEEKSKVIEGQIIEDIQCMHQYCVPINSNNETVIIGYHYWNAAWANQADFGSHG